jgi:predicted nucleic acid-binding protein
MKIVFNSSPLIFLSRLDYLEKFLATDDDFYLPKSVQIEINAKQDQSSDYINKLINNQQLIVKEINLISLANRLHERLGKGESDAIALGIELQTDYIILDDFAARKEAMRLGLNVKGTLAVIRKLLKEEKIQIDNLDSFYQRIRKINFRVKREIFDSIFND